MTLGDPELEAHLARSLLAGQRALVLQTDEDDRALLIAEGLSERLRWPLHTWSVAAGIDRGGRERELGGLLARLGQIAEDEIWLLFEAGRELRSSAQRRMLRELAQASRGPTLILIESDRASIPDIPELERERLAAPDRDQLRERVARLARGLEPERPALASVLLEASERIAAAGLGLTLRRFDQTLAAAILVDAPTPASITTALTRRRVAQVCGSALESVEPVAATALVGFDRYLAWLRERALKFDPAAHRAGLRPNGGVGLIGVPGCGHRLAARVSASVLGLPLLRVDRAGLAGPDALRSTIAALEHAAPVVLWIDESESDQHAELAAELAHRLSQQAVDVFTVATATRADGLPSPWRSGHGLDGLFFVDLPSTEARAQLLVQLLARTIDNAHPAPPLGDPIEQLLDLARAAQGCSGADLAQALTDARLRCFARGRPLCAAELDTALAERSRMATREPERIAALRAWAKALACSVALD